MQCACVRPTGRKSETANEMSIGEIAMLQGPLPQLTNEKSVLCSYPSRITRRQRIAIDPMTKEAKVK